MNIPINYKVGMTNDGMLSSKFIFLLNRRSTNSIQLRKAQKKTREGESLIFLFLSIFD